MGETSDLLVESGPRARTRRAILDAAVSVLSQDLSASMGDIAAAAGVGRTTLHRYFPERSDLLTAIDRDLLERAESAVTDARLDEGGVWEALERLCHAYFELDDALMLLCREPQFLDYERWRQETEGDRAVLRLIRRGQDQGVLDPDLDAVWIQQVLWALLIAALGHCHEKRAARYDALSLCLRTLRKAVSAGS
ncbi:TetR/AcrR family transcriptional regulator [Thermobifida halotolerans]|uniref:TetR/AcrR family transcriptional regulator n=1 Tax=Thermobifida halotolerans TaxID=483545 RepID=A0AA97LZ53_9ACTN|nr:TetR/AcrR family transcriptional regulator [Thermobifida halotolerans]UOE20962.1 TetR/AcrR family transcriptional regulator [Thermobifida halotolerans]